MTEMSRIEEKGIEEEPRNVYYMFAQIELLFLFISCKICFLVYRVLCTLKTRFLGRYTITPCVPKYEMIIYDMYFVKIG